MSYDTASEPSSATNVTISTHFPRLLRYIRRRLARITRSTGSVSSLASAIVQQNPNVRLTTRFGNAENISRQPPSQRRGIS